MKCSACGNELPEGAEFCGICGEKADAKTNVNVRKRKRKIFCWVGVAIGVVLIVAFVLFLKMRKEDEKMAPRCVKIYDVYDAKGKILAEERVYDISGRLLRETYYHPYGGIFYELEYVYENANMLRVIWKNDEESFYLANETRYEKERDIFCYWVDVSGHGGYNCDEIIWEYSEKNQTLTLKTKEGTDYRNVIYRKGKRIGDEEGNQVGYYYAECMEYDDRGVILGGTVQLNDDVKKVVYSSSYEYGKGKIINKVIAEKVTEGIDGRFAGTQNDVQYDKIIYLFNEQGVCIEEEKYRDGELKEICEYYY